MKTLALISVALLVFGSAAAQSWKSTFGMNYAFSLPTGGMKPYIKNGNGLTMNLLFEAPSHRIATGLEFAYTGYGHSKSEQEYVFEDGTVAPMNVFVNNSFTSIMAMTRLYLLVDGPVRPYVTFRAGYTHFATRLSIVDPDDFDHCEPVEKAILSRDGTLAYSAGGGLRIDAGLLFKKAEKGRFYFDISSNILQGGRVNYMNEDAPDPGTPHKSSPTRAKEVEARFIDTRTQVVHTHHVGYLYNSFVQMMDFRLGFSMRVFD
jgi:opacity protein-like surface antigen